MEVSVAGRRMQSSSMPTSLPGAPRPGYRAGVARAFAELRAPAIALSEATPG